MTKQPTEQDKIMTRHFLRFPYATVAFGKSFPMTVEFTFDFTEDDSTYGIEPVSTIGVAEGGTYDVSHLTKFDNSTFSNFLIETIEGNRNYWDTKPDEEGNEWWQKK